MLERRDLLININLLFLAIIAGAVVVYIAWRIFLVLAGVLVLLFAAMLLAFLLDPLVARLERQGFPRVLAVITVYIVLLGIIFGLGGLLIAPLASQIGGLAHSLPKSKTQLDTLVNNLNAELKRRHIPLDLKPLVKEGIPYAQRIGTEILGNSLTIVQTVSGIVIDVLAVIVISLYLLIDGPRIRHNILRVIPDSQRSNALFVDAAVRTVVGGYVRGQLLLALTIGLMATVGTFLLGLNYPLVIGFVAGFFELVPMLGPILGAIPAIGIAGFQGGWQLAAWTIVLFVVIQQLEAHVIAPRIMGHAVGVHPIVAILAVLLGAQLNGVIGALIAVPVAGIAYVISQAVYFSLTNQHQRVTVVQRLPFYIRVYRWVRGSPATVRAEARADVAVTVEAPSDQLAGIIHERDVLAEQFVQTEKRARRTVEHIETALQDGNGRGDGEIAESEPELELEGAPKHAQREDEGQGPDDSHSE